MTEWMGPRARPRCGGVGETMRIQKDGAAISTVEDWLRFAPPRAEGGTGSKGGARWPGAVTLADPACLRRFWCCLNRTRRYAKWSSST